MDNKAFLERLKNNIMVLDGSIGVLIRDMGLEPGEPPENLLLRKPEAVIEVHQRYLDAGADVLLTNTFGATRLRLKESQLDDRVDDINRKAVKLARQVCDGKALVGLSIGPLGKFIEPIGALEFKDALEIFTEQVRGALNEGPDIIVIETISDIREFKAAIIAVRSQTDLPLIAHMTFTEDGRAVTGTDPETCVTVATALGVDAAGANCSVGPKELFPVMQEMAGISTVPLSVEPNAGMPQLINGEAVYPTDPDEMARYAVEFAQIGVSLVGACCGSTPDHIRAIKNALDNKKPAAREVKQATRLSSRFQTVRVSDSLPTLLIGERINPSGRKNLTEAIETRNSAFLRKEAVDQVAHGAGLLDINMGISDKDPVGTMTWAIRTVQQSVRVPVLVDSSDPVVVETALEEVEGKTMINSVSGERESLEALVPLAVRYGSAILGITLDEDGIPESLEKRMEIARRIVEFATSHGIPLENIVIDPLALPVSAEQQKVLDSLRALRLIGEELGVRTAMGVSNVSFGLPERRIINSTFLSMALGMGLDLPIVNPMDESIMGAIDASDLLLGKDKRGTRYIKVYGARLQEVEEERLVVKELSASESIYRCVLDGGRDEIDDLVEAALDSGLSAQEITDDCLVRAMEEVGEFFENKNYFLPQVILSAETMQRGFSKVKPFLESGDERGKAGKILFATVKGDIHDIGKNICITLLENHGFEVLDLGKNVETEEIVEKARKEEVDVVALSALMTTTMVRMEEVVEKLKAGNVNARTLIGGAVVTREYADEIGADGYGANAVKAVKEVKKLTSKRSG
jgi:5-methyltetrahydrofolate--homocysteine methyltransferase